MYNEGFLACGGTPYRECSHLKLGSDAWSPMPSPQTERRVAGFIPMGNGLWVTGGSINLGAATSLVHKTTEFFSKDKWIWSVDLPAPRANHCMTKLNKNEIMIVGGLTSDLSFVATTLIYDRRSREFTTTHNFAPPRIGIGCASYTSTSGDAIVLVTGGQTAFDGVNLVPTTSMYVDQSRRLE